MNEPETSALKRCVHIVFVCLIFRLFRKKNNKINGIKSIKFKLISTLNKSF